MKIIGLAVLISIFCASCGKGHPPNDPATEVRPVQSVAASGVSVPVELGSLANAAFWIDPAAPESSLILGAAGISGIDLYTSDGRRAANFAEVDAGFVTVVPDPYKEEPPLVVVYDQSDAAIKAYRLDRDALRLHPAMPEPLELDDELTGLCHYHSRLSASDYLYAVTDAGLILHYELYARNGEIAGRLLRTIPSGKGSGFCAVDSSKARLYVSDESVGIWRLGAEPESDTEREPFEMRSPWGSLSEEVKGIGLYQVNRKLSYLIAADVGEDRIAVYKLPGGKLLGQLQVPELADAEGVAVTNQPVGNAYPQGLVAIADEDEAAGGTDLKFIGWQQLATALKLETANPDANAGDRANAVRPVLETEVAASYGDAADDPAIWPHPHDPSKSLVIGTDKQLGLYVFDLQGRTVQVLPDGRMNNVDLRGGFPLGGEQVTLVTASNRSTDSIAAYKIDVENLQLTETAAGTLRTGFTDPYGLCMYRSAGSGEFYVFVNEGGNGTYRQWRLHDNGNGKVAAEQVREFEVGSQAEGCVADDELGYLYINEEDVGLWKYAAEPDGGDARTLIDDTEDGRLKADVEGVSLWAGDNGQGYLVVSNQGADNYAVYRREGDNAYVGHFHVVANAAENVDGSSETDGLAVSSAAMGERFPSGLLVVQDGRNIAPEERQNFKYVSWAEVMEALQIE